LILQCNGSTELTKLKPLIKEVFPQNTTTAGRSNLQFEDSLDGFHQHYDDEYYDDAQSETGSFYSIDDEIDETVETFIDESGFLMGTEEAIDIVHASIAEHDEEYEKVFVSFVQARDLLKQATVARQFYPVVVPAGYIAPRKPFKGKGKGKGAIKSGKGLGFPAKPKGKGKGKGKSGNRVVRKPFNRPGGKGRTASPSTGTSLKSPMSADGDAQPICYKCGKPGHFAAQCPSQDSPLKRQRQNLHTEWWDEGEEESWEESQVITAMDTTVLNDDRGPNGFYCSECTVQQATVTRVANCCNEWNHKHSWHSARQDMEDRVLAFNLTAQRGCALMDSGATRGVGSLNSLDQLQRDLDSDRSKVLGLPVESQMGFTVGDGEVVRSKFAAPLRGLPGTVLPSDSDYNIAAVGGDNNHSPLIIGVDFLFSHKVVVDYETGQMFYKNDPRTVFTLKRSQNKYLYFPITKEQCDQHLIVEKLTDEQLFERFTKPQIE